MQQILQIRHFIWFNLYFIITNMTNIDVDYLVIVMSVFSPHTISAAERCVYSTIQLKQDVSLIMQTAW